MSLVTISNKLSNLASTKLPIMPQGVLKKTPTAIKVVCEYFNLGKKFVCCVSRS